jgi:4-hydroxy-3-methylbut-2-enyl diphosphate reductase
MDDAKLLGEFVTGAYAPEHFFERFAGKYSAGFDPKKHLQRVGVVNQTTMLATETQSIADYFKQLMIERYGAQNLKEHFADTRDTLCYATNDNQDATYQLLETDADLAIVVGGYNSSNTSHIVELCEQKFATFFINSEREMVSETEIHHFHYLRKEKAITYNYLPEKRPVKIILTSGASCPDTLVDRVMLRLLTFFADTKPVEELMKHF